MARGQRPLRIGLLGAGVIARIHARNLVRHAAVIEGVCDRDTSRARSLAKDFDCSFSTDNPRALLSRAAVDAVFVCTPNRYHAPHAVAALKAGRHVFVEKPMATAAAGCVAVIRAATRARRRVMVGFYHRFWPETTALHQLIRRRRLGEIYHAQAVCVRRRGIPALGSWFTTQSQAGGGALMDVGVHVIDLVLWLLGHPALAAVSAQTYSRFGPRRRYVYTHMWGAAVPGGPFDVEDYATAMVRFNNGATLHIECGWAANTQDALYAELLGDRGGVRFTPGEPFALLTEDAGRVADIRPQVAHADAYELEVAHFIDCLRRGRKPMVSGADGLAVQGLIDAIYRSSRSGREVRLMR